MVGQTMSLFPIVAFTPHAVSDAPDATPDRKVSQQIAAQLLEGAGVNRVAIQTEGMRRLVLDIRGNPGGPLDQAIKAGGTPTK